MSNNVKVRHVDPAKVAQVYSGKRGKCCCGCAGNHHYRANAAGPGYEVERSDASVERVMRNMNRALKQVGGEYSVNSFNPYVAVEVGERQYVAYFN